MQRGSTFRMIGAIWCLHLLSGCLGMVGTSSNVKHRNLQQQQQHQETKTPTWNWQEQLSVMHPAVAERHLSMPPKHSAGAGAALALNSRDSSRQYSSYHGDLPPGRHARQLLHLDSIDTADTADQAAAAGMVSMYPRDASAVQKYLSDAMKSGQGPLEVPVWFLVVIDPKNPSSSITQQDAERQIDLLNRAYRTGLPDGSGVISEDAASASSSVLWRFKLLGVRHTHSNVPMCIGGKMEEQMKAKWHPVLMEATQHAGHGGALDRTLVIYTSDLTSPMCDGLVPGYRALFGWSNTPMELQAWKKRRQAYKDGVVLDFRFLSHSDSTANEAGSKSLRGASTGAQLIHEVGHWMGLLHTFVGGCNNNLATSDGVDDTPAEAHPRSWGVDLGDASGSCWKNRDTCPGLPGVDDYSNYMSYNNLACARRFTPGQQARMLYAFTSMRAATQ